MDRKFHLLESFHAQGSDGQTYKVLGFEHLRREEVLNSDGQEHWASTGVAEYRLDSGELVEAEADGTLHVATTGLRLSRV